jgi:hypothetical protein
MHTVQTASIPARLLLAKGLSHSVFEAKATDALAEFRRGKARLFHRQA